MVGYRRAVVHGAASTQDASTMYCKWDKGTVARVGAQLTAQEPLLQPLLLVVAELELEAYEPYLARPSQPH